MIKYFGLFLLLFLFACKGDKSASNPADQLIIEDKKQIDPTENTSDYNVNFNSKVSDYVYDTPDPTSFFTDKDVEEVLGLESGAVYNIINNGKSTDRARSAFYKVSDPEKSNAAVLIRALANPYYQIAKTEGDVLDFTFENPDDELPIEFKNWAANHIKNKIDDGEHSLNDPNLTVIFVKWDMGMSGAMHEEEGSYYWRDEKGIIYHIAFNITSTTKKKKAAAEKLAKMVTP